MSKRSPGVSIIAVDTGGTFTDVVAVVGGRRRVAKVPSTPDDPARAVLTAIRQVLGDGSSHSQGSRPFTLVHGSTVATNTLLERTGARVGLVTNRGFEDVIEIGRQNRPQLYAVVGHRPPPLVHRDDRHGVAGRLGPGGEEIEPLDGQELASLADRLKGVEAVAICCLHSYADPAHEERIAQAVATLGLPVSVSARLLPEYREFERTATTVVNAYVAPRMERYLGRLASESGARHVRIMGSGGGAIPVDRARRDPVHTVLSGPAGGVMGALRVAREAGFRDILTFDMGGTSTDVSLCPGTPLHTREFVTAGVPIAIPMIDILTVGAGGGSIAQLDAGGALRVGPRSAGADPGPVSYGRGGRQVTVTDAHVWLGRLPPDLFLGGRTQLDRSAVEDPLSALADRMDTTPEEAAAGIIDVADTAMEGALRVISVERGHDPADFTLVPFGGAAGLHAVALAERLGIPRLLVPPGPGVLSALGMLVSPVRKDAARSVLFGDAGGPDDRVASVLAELEREALVAMVQEGLSAEEVTLRRLADVRYAAQSYELTVPADGWAGRFHRAHAARYGFAREGAALELVTLRVEATGPEPELNTIAAHPADPIGAAEAGSHGSAPTAESGPARRVWLDGEWSEARPVARVGLKPGATVQGPAIIHEYSATFWLPAGWTAEVLGDGSLLARPSRR